ncbi:MAG: hypothetical protein ACJAUD_000102 [Crocinitomicaceae bacterium]|jgi:hypothetical protein
MSTYIAQEALLLKNNKVKELKIKFVNAEDQMNTYGIYRFDTKGQLIYKTEGFLSTDPDSFFEYCYDNNGQKVKSNYTRKITAINHWPGDSSIFSHTYNEGDPVIDTLIEYSYYTYNANGQRVSTHHYNEQNDHLKYSFQQTYNDGGERIKSASTSPFSSTKEYIRYYSYSYQNGLKASESVFLDSNLTSISLKTFFQYNAKKQVITEAMYEFNLAFEGDSILAVLRTAEYHTSGELKSETITEYDTFLFKTWSHKRAFESKRKTMYNEDGLTISELEYNKKDNITTEHNWTYEYYPNGLLKSQRKVAENSIENGEIIYVYTFY